MAIDGSHLFPIHTTWIGFLRGAPLRRYMYDFVLLVAPHLERRLIELASTTDDAASLETLLRDVKLSTWPLMPQGPVAVPQTQVA